MYGGEGYLQVEMLLRTLRDIHPAIVVCAGIVAIGLVNVHQARGTHASSEDEVAYRVIQTLLDSIHALLVDGGIEDGLCSVLVHEGDGTV